MMRRLSPTAFLLLIVCAGCAAPPLAMEPVATVSNGATLSYAYGTGKPFRAKTAPVRIAVMKPVASGESASAKAGTASMSMSAGTGNASAAARIDQRAATSQLAVERGNSKTRQAEAVAASASESRAGFATERSARGSMAQADARASQTSRSEVSSESYRAAAAGSSALVRKSSMSATNFAGTGKAEAHRSRTEGAAAASAVSARRAQARSDWSVERPEIRKWANCEWVVVGDRFKYFVEISNDTGFDLAFAEVGDRLDARLSVNPAKVQIHPDVRNVVALTNRLLSVKFPNGIQRGRRIRIAIPVVLASEVDE